MSPHDQPTPLAMHNLDTLCDELASGRGVVDEQGNEFRIRSQEARALFDWYRRNRARWGKYNTREDVESQLDCLGHSPSELPPLLGVGCPSPRRVLHLRSLRAHRFAGLHHYGSPSRPPPDFEVEFSCPLMVIEGGNGSGKTSLLNSIAWCLTGHVYRSQGPPQRIDHLVPAGVAGGGEEAFADDASQTMSAITPLPAANVLEELGEEALPLDTWVELSFADEQGREVGTLRRSIARRGRTGITCTEPDFAALGLPPMSLDIAALLPALLPHLPLGAPSDLGKAVAALTGIRPLQDVARHAEKSQAKLRKDLYRERQAEIAAIDQNLTQLWRDLAARLSRHPDLGPRGGLPALDNALRREEVAVAVVRHLEGLQAETLAEARHFLDDQGDGHLAGQDLRARIGPAIGLLDRGSLEKLPSAQRLGGLGKLTEEELVAAEALLGQIADEARELAALAEAPARATRLRLYARVAGWMHEHPGQGGMDECPVCRSSLHGKFDRETGEAVAEQLKWALSQAADFLGKSAQSWQAETLATLPGRLPAALRGELERDLPAHPGELIAELIEELLASSWFDGSLAPLRQATRTARAAALAELPGFTEPEGPQLPSIFGGQADLAGAIRRVTRAIGFARWRRRHAAACGEVFARVIGKVGAGPAGIRSHEGPALAQRLAALDRLVRDSEPLTEALALARSAATALRRRGELAARLALYARAAAALEELVGLRDFIDRQVGSLLGKLSARAGEWKARLYAPAAAAVVTECVPEAGADGTFAVVVRSQGAQALAHDVSNASDLRATLLAFLLAFREHALQNRGGLSLFLLDDPQDLFDPSNRGRLAQAIALLVEDGARMIVTTSEPAFARELHAAVEGQAIEHRVIEPSRTGACLRSLPSGALREEAPF